MRELLYASLRIALMLAALTCAVRAAQPSAEPETTVPPEPPSVSPADGNIAMFIKLSTLTKDIEKAIANARLIIPEPPFFIIRKIDLKLQGARKAGGQGEFSIPVWVFNVALDADVTLEHHEELEVELVPPTRAVVGGDSLVDITPLVQSLKNAFAADRKGGLLAARVKYTIKWALQRAVEGGVDITVIKIGAGISEKRAQVIVFHLCQSEDRKTCVPVPK